ncbi:MAG: DUF1456 family protein [Spirochaetales bacterium]|nr:DUF1456 family protein [Spirochaetales bacterium]
MTNNDVLRRIRYIFSLKDEKMMSIFRLADFHATRAQVCDWLKKDDDSGYQEISDKEMAIFLNGFINYKRGKKEGPQPEPEESLTNNIIFRKIKIALNLQAEEILAILNTVDVHISKHELSAFFRREDHKHYRKCQDQILRNFLHGIEIKYHDRGLK